MAEPTHNLPEEDRPEVRPNLRAMEGLNSNAAGHSSGGATSSAGSSTGTGGRRSFSYNPSGSGGSSARSLSPGGLSAAENSAGLGASGAGFWSASDQTKPGSVKRFIGGNKKKLLGGGGVVGLLIGGFMGLSFLSGPAQFVHLAELLQHNFTKLESDSGNRTSHLLRSFKAIKEGDYRYTRVGLIGAKVMDKVVGQFEDAGVKFTGSDALGRPTGIEVDKNKVAQNYPEVKEMNSSEFDNWLNEKFDVSPGTSFKDGELDISGLKAQSIRDYIGKASTKILGDNAALAAAKTRVLKDFFGLPSLFHPFSRALQDKIAAKAAQIKKNSPNESTGAAEEQAASDVETSAYESNVSTVEEPGVDSFNEGHAEANGKAEKLASNVAPYVGTLYGTACMLKGTATAITGVNRFLIVLPAAIEATNLIAMGSEVQNGGNDLTAEQLGAAARGLTNSQGQSIWAGAALQATEGADKANFLPKNSDGSVANDIPPKYKQAFGSDTLASTLQTIGNAMLVWFPFPSWLHGPCGFLGGITLSVVGVAGQVLDAIVNAPDGETLDAGSQAAVRGLEDAGISYGKSEAMAPVMNAAIDWIAKSVNAPKLTRSAFSGALGGNLIAYGARAAANSAAILNGGLSLANKATTIVGSAGQEEQQQFQSESLFARIFDINDYRSLFGRFSMAVSPSIGADLSSSATSMFNIGGIFSSMFGHLMPNVAAAGNSSWTGSYNWEFPQYGLPDNMLNDPALSDPYQNSEAVGQYLSNTCKDDNGNIGPSYGVCGGSGGYTQRIMDCFGNKLTYSEDSDIGGNVWDVTHAATATSSDNDVNPLSDTYHNANCGAICPGTIANCGDAGKENWEKIVMFVNDANNIKTLDCLEGSSDTAEQSCSDVGFNGSAPSGSGAGGSTSLPAGNTQQLAQQIIQLHDQGKIIYALDTSAIASNFQRMANGQDPVTNNGHQPTPDPRILQAVIYLAQLGTVQINSYVDGASHTQPGNPHYEGKAIDIGAFNGRTLGSADEATTREVESIVAQVLPAGSRFGADFYTDSSWTAPINLDGKTFYTGHDAGGHLHMDTLNVN